MNFAKTCLAVLIGVVIGASLMAVIRPQPVKAQEPSRTQVRAQGGGTVFIDTVNPSNAGQHGIQGSRVVGFSCIQATTSTPPWCAIASQ